MSLVGILLVASTCSAGDALEEARLLLQRGLLDQVERHLAPLIAADSADVGRRAQALLLLGNVDFERGLYLAAIERYSQVERETLADPAILAAAQGNREMAEQRQQRSREFGVLATRLRASVATVLALAGIAVALLARQRRNDVLGGTDAHVPPPSAIR